MSGRSCGGLVQRCAEPIAQRRHLACCIPFRLCLAVALQNEGESSDAAGASPDASAAAAAPALLAPAGRLDLTVDTVTLSSIAASGDVFLVLKCGPHWGRSKVLPLAGGWAKRGAGASRIPL